MLFQACLWGLSMRFWGDSGQGPQKGWVGLEVWGLLITLEPEPQLNFCKLPDAISPVNADLIPHPLWVTASFWVEA